MAFDYRINYQRAEDTWLVSQYSDRQEVGSSALIKHKRFDTKQHVPTDLRRLMAVLDMSEDVNDTGMRSVQGIGVRYHASEYWLHGVLEDVI